ncbi:MAG: hypothetical protein BGO31_10935 [Bacteroidetes bacterium 43-16]|uniref:hypothetical protein n=1 Tax=uncultured Dysgonomonas sp. TaxID=206096 RepID=UPI000926412E|nr:hypothetical protein [uncultured Dysgonomonas sp.]OJV50974.1 MAG: hypothetical protein BGO31_10935 [Bacteroidetes bacterium 43-16]
MESKITKETIDFCDKHVKNGNELKITWDGGNDSGYIELILNEIELLDADQDVAAIISFAYTVLGYGSFDGDFSTSGEAIYDPDKKSFIGIDNYSHSESDIHPFNIQIRFPQSLWFDSIRLNYEIDDDNTTVQVDIDCLITNGPRLDCYEKFEKMAAEIFVKDLQKEIEALNSFETTWDELIIERSQLQEVGNELVYIMTELTYSLNKNEQKPITICLIN